MDSVNIELLIVPNCPNEQTAAKLLRTALDETGLGQAGFQTVVITDPETAERTGFTGSPTFMVNGVDLFPDATRSNGLSCRLYRRPDGVAGVPELTDLGQALQAALAK